MRLIIDYRWLRDASLRLTTAFPALPVSIARVAGFGPKSLTPVARSRDFAGSTYRRISPPSSLDVSPTRTRSSAPSLRRRAPSTCFARSTSHSSTTFVEKQVQGSKVACERCVDVEPRKAGIYYKDLYALVCYLPKYNLPAGSGNFINRTDLDVDHRQQHVPHRGASIEVMSSPMSKRSSSSSVACTRTHPPLRSNTAATWTSMATYNAPRSASPIGEHEKVPTSPGRTFRRRRIVPPVPLLPSRNPPAARLEDWIPWCA